jgi:hypothetical protein
MLVYIIMILLKSLIILLILIIIAHFVKKGWVTKKNTGPEGFQNQEVDSITDYYSINIANDLEAVNSPHQLVMQPPVATSYGGELAPPIGVGKLTPSQKVQGEAKDAQRQEESQTIDNHKEVADKALDMNYLKEQMDELLRLGNEAELINENFKNMKK